MMLIFYCAGIHQYRLTQHAHLSTQRFPLGAERTHRGVGLSQENTKTAGGIHSLLCVLYLLNVAASRE